MDCCIKGVTAIFMLIIWTQGAHGIIGYDCGSASANLTTLSLINVDECDIPLQPVNSSRVYVQLLQLNDFKSVNVIQCKIEIDRTIKKCGMFSHTMDVHNGQFSYITEVSREACQRMHTYGNFEIASTHIVVRSGVTCELSTTRCTDIEGDDTFWNPVPTDHCKFSDYGVLYNGYANKIFDASNELSQTAYSLTG
ncbi:hypothetical protein ALC60_05683 [Trachymyrmex zeteki]|uniref:Uncharacterized protein n=1 Tax=Mycetomoellerius zeteki TaxID=64791 RepID=A0A151X4N2_9HYME|nr:hypothetical protein ALC60_05683 [Trachymyrmex zeteki]